MNTEKEVDWDSLPTEIKNKIFGKVAVASPQDLVSLLKIADGGGEDAAVFGELSGGANAHDVRLLALPTTRLLLEMLEFYYQLLPPSFAIDSIRKEFHFVSPGAFLQVLRLVPDAPLEEEPDGSYAELRLHGRVGGVPIELGAVFGQGRIDVSFGMCADEYRVVSHATTWGERDAGDFAITVNLQSTAQALDEDDWMGVNFLPGRLQEAGYLPDNPDDIGRIRAYGNIAALLVYMAAAPRMKHLRGFRDMANEGAPRMYRFLRELYRLYKWEKRGGKPGAEEYFAVLRLTFDDELDYAEENPIQKYFSAVSLDDIADSDGL